MGFRFRRSIRLLPGIRINLARRASLTIGVRGLRTTFGSTGTRTTVGLPGSGLSYTHLEKAHHAPTAAAQPIAQGKAWRGWLWVLLFGAAIAVALSWAR
jgi:hypothetical protein